MTDNASGEITVEVDREDIEYLMETGPTRIKVSDGPISVYARCMDSLEFEVVTDE